MLDGIEAALRGPAPRYAAATGAGYAAATLERCWTRDGGADRSNVTDGGAVTAGLLVAERYLGGDPFTYMGFVAGAALSDRRAADPPRTDGGAMEEDDVAEMLEP